MQSQSFSVLFSQKEPHLFFLVYYFASIATLGWALLLSCTTSNQSEHSWTSQKKVFIPVSSRVLLQWPHRFVIVIFLLRFPGPSSLSIFSCITSSNLSPASTWGFNKFSHHPPSQQLILSTPPIHCQMFCFKYLYESSSNLYVKILTLRVMGPVEGH